ncbi:hypothetical protein [Actinomadura atramentaria]|nr:hypothetical protein [Actinomadura atramentaria]
MTPTARLAAARRRRLQIISRTVLDRAMHDPRRTAVADTGRAEPAR